MCMVFFFFFSSRRRHTRCSRDWSSDVCSSDLPIRQYAEDWTLDRILKSSEEAVTYAVRHGLPVMYVTEDTTRAKPETLKALYGAAIDCGATRICLADTVGRSEEHTSELQSRLHLVCRLLLE